MIRDAEVFAKAQAAALPMRAYGSEGSEHRADLIQLATLVWKGANE